MLCISEGQSRPLITGFTMYNFTIVIIGFIAGFLTFFALNGIASEIKGPNCSVPMTAFCKNLAPQLEDI